MVGVVSVYLNAHGTLVILDVHLLDSLVDIAYKSLTCNKLRVHQIRAVLLAYIPERHVGDVLHRGEYQRVMRYLYVSYLEHFLKILRKVTNFFLKSKIKTLTLRSNN